MLAVLLLFGERKMPSLHALRQQAYHCDMNKPYFVRAEWDADAEVWVATSDDVPGLVTEAATIEALHDKLKSMVPELLEANGCMPSEGQIAVELLARRFSVALSAVA
jgi:predicted RNase H-like HicB family nuclease